MLPELSSLFWSFLSFLPLFYVPSHSEMNGKSYVEAIFIHNESLSEAVQKVSGVVCGAELCVAVAECVLLCGTDSYPEYPVQDRYCYV